MSVAQLIGLFLFTLGAGIAAAVFGWLVPLITSVIPDNEWNALLNVITWIVAVLFVLSTSLPLLIQGFLLGLIKKD